VPGSYPASSYGTCSLSMFRSKDHRGVWSATQEDKVSEKKPEQDEQDENDPALDWSLPGDWQHDWDYLWELRRQGGK
jgi:hypothetical protein